jgi:hypothetical protein
LWKSSERLNDGRFAAVDAQGATLGFAFGIAARPPARREVRSAHMAHSLRFTPVFSRTRSPFPNTTRWRESPLLPRPQAIVDAEYPRFSVADMARRRAHPAPSRSAIQSALCSRQR